MTNETQKPDEQPYFTVKVTQCDGCPNGQWDGDLEARICDIAPFTKARKAYLQNSSRLTPSCPMWAQVQQEKKDA